AACARRPGAGRGGGPVGVLGWPGWPRRRREPGAPVDPRAEELRKNLAESRAIVEKRDEFEDGELTVALAEPAPEDPESRRRAVHESARATVEQMRKR